MLTYADYRAELNAASEMYRESSELRAEAARRLIAARSTWIARDREMLAMRDVVEGEFEEGE